MTAISRFMRVFKQPPQRADVAVLNVAAILAQMQGDAVGAGLLRQQRGLHRLRILAAPRLPHSGDVIDVDAEAMYEWVKPPLQSGANRLT